MKAVAGKAWSLLKAVLKGYRDDDCNQSASVISFYAIFSMLPLAMITVAILAYLVGYSGDLVARFEALIQSVIPTAAGDLFQVMHAALAKKQRVSLISAGILIVIASFMVSALERALDRVFRTEKKRNFFHSKILAVGFLFVFILLFATPGILHLFQITLVKAKLLAPAAVFSMSGDLFFFFVAFGAFFFGTTVIPNRKVYMRYSFIGAIVFTVLTGVARLIFREYIVASWDRYDVIYGSLTVMIVLMVWVYYLANIFLLSAELVARLQEKKLSSGR